MLLQPLLGIRARAGGPEVVEVPLDLQRTLHSTFLLVVAAAWPLLFAYRRRVRPVGARTPPLTRFRTAEASAFAGCSVLTAVGGGLLVAAGVL